METFVTVHCFARLEFQELRITSNEKCSNCPLKWNKDFFQQLYKDFQVSQTIFNKFQNNHSSFKVINYSRRDYKIKKQATSQNNTKVRKQAKKSKNPSKHPATVRRVRKAIAFSFSE
jgi:hypothetical protein